MSDFKNVLLVTNSAREDEITQIHDTLLQRCPELLQQSDSMKIRLRLVHVIPNLPACYFNIPSMVMLAERYYEEATEILTRVGEKLNVSRRDQWLITGRIRSEVLRLAKQLEAHFILASSSCLQELRQSFIFPGKTGQMGTTVQSISSLASITA